MRLNNNHLHHYRSRQTNKKYQNIYRSKHHNNSNKYYYDVKKKIKAPYRQISSSSESVSSSSSSASSSSSSASYSSSPSSTVLRRKTPHYKYQIGQKIGHKYRLTHFLGDGTFGRVVQALYHDNYYAIKIIKPVEKYINSAHTQKSIIKQINQLDSNNQFGIVRFIQSFYHYKYYCLVFQPLGKSLYEIIKKNQYQGFPIFMVQSFFKQILKSIAFLHKIKFTHTDLKPENILLQKKQFHKVEWKTKQGKKKQSFIPTNLQIKIIDFGGATKQNQHHSSTINTRQYRSPEVILQCGRWTQASDVWSIGCIISELYTGQLLFETHDDEQHLLMIQKNSGLFPKWMRIQSKKNFRKIFTQNGSINENYLTNRVSKWQNIIGMKTVPQLFSMHPQLTNLLQKILHIDPYMRITCEEALKHSFFKIQY